MTLNKLTTDIQPLTEVDKINEIIDSVNSITIPSVGNGTVSFTQNGHQKGSFSANQNSNTTIDFDLSSRNIGEIVTSAIPLTDAGLHLLDGALIQGSGVYADFVSYIASIYSSSASCFCTESEWQASVTQYGVCGKFVYNSTNNTVRLPKYSNKIWSGEGAAPVVGNGSSIGLTTNLSNIGSIGIANDSSGTRLYAYLGDNVSLPGSLPGASMSSTNRTALGLTTDGTKSGILAQLSNITTSLDGYYYIVIAASTKTNIQVDIDEVTTDLNGKADADLSNVPASKGILTESYINGSSWYRVYADGWCEQGGILTVSGTSQVINFLKPYINTNYIITYANGYNSVPSGTHLVCFGNKTTNSITRFGSASWTLTYWRTEGYIR